MENISGCIKTIYLILSILITFFCIYFKTRSEISSGMTSFIRDAAEYDNLTGLEKMDMVISWTKNFIPRAFKIIFTDEVLRKMAQNVYEDMKAYSKNYVKEKTGLSINQIEKYAETLNDPEYDKDNTKKE